MMNCRPSGVRRYLSPAFGRLLIVALIGWSPAGQGALEAPDVVRPPRARPAAKTNALPPLVVVAPTVDTLRLLNGDRLQGRLVGVDGVGGLLTWQHKAVRELLHFQTSALDKVELLPRKSAGVAHHQQLLQLVNGDRLCGDVVTLDATQLVFKTWYAGTLNIAHTRLAELIPAAGASDVFYDGPTADLTGWDLDENEQGSRPAFRKGGLVLPAGRSVGRKLPKLPDKVRLELELTGWQSAGLMLCFFCKDTKSPEGEAYGLHLMGNRVELMHNTTDGDTASLGAVDLEEQAAMRQRLQVTLLVERKERRFLLLLNGRLVREFKDQRDLKDGGESFILQTMEASALRLIKFKVSRWDGRVPRLDAAETDNARDTVVLTNGDTLAGEVRAIAQGRVRFTTAFGTLEIPLDRIGRLRFAGPPPVAATKGTRCFFNEQDALTVQIEKLAEETITGSADGIGVLKLPLGIFTALEFNPGVRRDHGDDEDL